MKNLMFCILSIALFSCSKEPIISDAELSGTWLLTHVSGSCALLPIDDSADEQGCIANPALEVNCSIIEILGGGELSYAYSLVKGEGSYTIESDGITICTDRCLVYTFDNNRLQLQTGTIAACDPIYTFQKTTSTLDQLIESSSVKRIKRVMRNGVLNRLYTYDANGLQQQSQTYTTSGDLLRTHVYTYTPLMTSRLTTQAASSSISITNTYFEAADRLRTDLVDSDGQLEGYWLYFYEPSYMCSYSRAEFYVNDALERLSNVDFSGGNCDSEQTNFVNGQLTNVTKIERDDKRSWSQSLRDPLLPNRDFGNVTAYTNTSSEGEVSISSYTVTYQYDSQGYPSSSIRTYVDGSTAIYTYEYD